MKKENKIIPGCSETEILIDEYLEGMIRVEDKELMEEHLKNCPACSEYFKNTEKLIRNLKELGDENPYLSSDKKNELWESIEKKIDFSKHVKEAEEKRKKPADEPEQGFFSRYKYVFAGVAAILILFAFYFAIKNTEIKQVQLSEQSMFGLPTYWKVSSIRGTPLIGGNPVSSKDSIMEGQFILTNDTSEAELFIADLGRVIIEPNTKVVFIKGTDGNNRIAVEYGTIEADMVSDRKEFFVELPSAVASDTKGKYKLTIDPEGDGLVYVNSGNVEIQSPNREAIVPAGNFVMTKKNIGVGTPFNENSSIVFKKALAEFDFGNCEESCVNTLLKTAKNTDAVSLVNIIPRVDEKFRNEIYTTAANFVTPPVNISQDSLYTFDEEKMKVWIYKIQEDVEKEVKKNMKEVEKNMEEVEKNIRDVERNIKQNLENLKEIEKIHFDTLQWLENLKDLEKNKVYKFEMNPRKNSYRYEYKGDTVYFDKKEFDQSMKELQEELKKLDFDKQLKEDLDKNNEELKKEMEKMKIELRNALKDVKKDTAFYNKIIEEVQKNIPVPPEVPDVKNNNPDKKDNSEKTEDGENSESGEK